MVYYVYFIALVADMLENAEKNNVFWGLGEDKHELLYI